MTDNPFERGHVVWHPALHRDSGGRPYLILSDETHPFHGEEYIAAGITTTERDAAIEITPADWQTGSLSKTSYVSPWYLTTVKHANITQGVGALDTEFMTTVQAELESYLF